MTFELKQTGSTCGAIVTGLDLTQPLSATSVAELREAWVKHLLLIFPEQVMTEEDLERFTRYFGDFGVDPYFESIPGPSNIVAIERRAGEQAPVFAESWHSDWSFQSTPPAGTCLYSLKIPPVGGDTGFANQQLAYQQMPDALKTAVAGKVAIHSAASGYAPEGLYGNAEREADRSMRIVISEDARATQQHPLVRPHPESGVAAIFSCLGYIIGIEGMPEDEARDLLTELYRWQTHEQCVYMHAWQENMLVMWDNRSLLHRAHGGYDGYDRLLYRTTIAGIS